MTDDPAMAVTTLDADDPLETFPDVPTDPYPVQPDDPAPAPDVEEAQ